MYNRELGKKLTPKISSNSDKIESVENQGEKLWKKMSEGEPALHPNMANFKVLLTLDFLTFDLRQILTCGLKLLDDISQILKYMNFHKNRK